MNVKIYGVFYLLQFSHSWEYLWRLSRAYVAVYDVQDTYDQKSLFASTALEYAKTALTMKNDSADVHKWYVYCCYNHFLQSPPKITVIL